MRIRSRMTITLRVDTRGAWGPSSSVIAFWHKLRPTRSFLARRCWSESATEKGDRRPTDRPDLPAWSHASSAARGRQDKAGDTF